MWTSKTQSKKSNWILFKLQKHKLDQNLSIAKTKQNRRNNSRWHNFIIIFKSATIAFIIMDQFKIVSSHTCRTTTNNTIRDIGLSRTSTSRDMWWRSESYFLLRCHALKGVGSKHMQNINLILRKDDSMSMGYSNWFLENEIKSKLITPVETSDTCITTRK